MTPPNTPTKNLTRTPVREPRRGSDTVPTRARQTQRPPDSRRSSAGWLVWIGIAAALVAAIWLVIAGVTIDDRAVPTTRAEEASTARLQGLADQYEAVRSARANQAATARLQGLADQYEAVRTARANQAATARLQGLADRYQLAP